jgi:RNA polymerase sigma factor (TIGR02999 family)
MQEAYSELRWMARLLFNNEQPGQTLQPTALVHETFLRLLRTGPKHYVNRAHFFSCAARAMRRVLLDAGRRRRATKRGGGLERVPLEDVGLCAPEVPDYAAIDTALARLRRFDRKLAKIVELRIFVRLTVRETAEALELAESTVRKRWSLAQAWLRADMRSKLQSGIAQTNDAQSTGERRIGDPTSVQNSSHRLRNSQMHADKRGLRH